MKTVAVNEHVKIRIQKSQARFMRIRNPEGRDTGVGNFLLLLVMTAIQETLYVPISIASGKKPTGLVYHIEGTAEGSIVTAEVSCSGEGVTQLTSGTIVYAKIPKGKTGIFRVRIEMRGSVGKTYAVAINRINYKLAPSDARYQKYQGEIRSRTLQFR